MAQPSSMDPAPESKSVAEIVELLPELLGGVGMVLLGSVLGLAVLALLLMAYFMPTLIARDREHHNTGAIFVLNLVAGWMFIGWLVALVWSFTAVRPPEPTRPRTPPRIY